MCDFMYYATLVKTDIDNLPDARLKDAFQKLYEEICEEGKHV